MKFTDFLWNSIGEIYGKILEHPFIQGLTDGSLSEESFRFYAVQDALYLRDFARGLAVLGAKAPEDGWLMAGDGPGELDGPRGVCVDAAGAIYVADTNNHRVQVFEPAGGLRLGFGEEGTDAGLLYYPRVVRVNAAGDMFVADSKQGRIQKFNRDGRFVFQVVMPADAGLVEDFAVDGAGRFLVALRSANLVMRLEVL